jgi:hypothetical protein
MHRGVVGRIVGSPKELAKDAATALAHAPLLADIGIRFDYGDRSPDLSPLAGSPLLARARSIEITGPASKRLAGWAALELPEVRSLSLGSVTLSAEDVETLLAAPRVPKLESLSIGMCRFNKGALEPLAKLRCPLRRFDLPAGHAGAALGEVLGKFRGLTYLRIPG